MILNINEEQADALIAGLKMQQEYIRMSLNSPDVRGAVRSNLTSRTTTIDVLLTKLNAKQEGE